MFLKNPEQLRNNKTLKERFAQLDFYGAAFLIPAVVCLLLALQWGGTKYPWNNAKIIGLFCAFGVILIIFIVIQVWQGPNATIPPGVFFQRSIFFSSMFSFCAGASFLIVVYYIPLYFQGVKGVSATRSGIMTLPLLISVVLFSVAGGIMVTVVGYYTPSMIAGMAIFCIGCGLLSTLSPDTSLGKWFGYQVLAGAGIGSCLQVLPRFNNF
jgi:Fungal trichothecene efflux pump (TRI12)